MRALVDRVGNQRLLRTAGQDVQGAGVQDMAAVAFQHRQEHLVAALGAFDEHRRHHRHHHPREALMPDALADVLEADRRIRAQPFVIRAQQLLVVGAAILAPGARIR